VYSAGAGIVRGYLAKHRVVVCRVISDGQDSIEGAERCGCVRRENRDLFTNVLTLRQSAQNMLKHFSLARQFQIKTGFNYQASLWLSKNTFSVSLV